MDGAKAFDAVDVLAALVDEAVTLTVESMDHAHLGQKRSSLSSGRPGSLMETRAPTRRSHSAISSTHRREDQPALVERTSPGADALCVLAAP
jgi:hypothetical protein